MIYRMHGTIYVTWLFINVMSRSNCTQYQYQFNSNRITPCQSSLNFFSVCHHRFQIEYLTTVSDVCIPFSCSIVRQKNETVVVYLYTVINKIYTSSEQKNVSFIQLDLNCCSTVQLTMILCFLVKSYTSQTIRYWSVFKGIYSTGTKNTLHTNLTCVSLISSHKI